MSDFQITCPSPLGLPSQLKRESLPYDLHCGGDIFNKYIIQVLEKSVLLKSTNLSNPMKFVKSKNRKKTGLVPLNNFSKYLMIIIIRKSLNKPTLAYMAEYCKGKFRFLVSVLWNNKPGPLLLPCLCGNVQ